MKVLVSGSTGMVGTALIHALKQHSHHVVRLVRKPGAFDEAQILWDIRRKQLDPADLAGIEAVIHLAGANIAAGRWTPARKREIANSRVAGTRLLCDTLAQMGEPPRVLISASAVGYYGNRGDETLTEVSRPGHGFLADTCRHWEQATAAAAEKGIRVVSTRFGIILSPRGGALKAMLWPFRLGLAGNLSLQGRQFMSWVTLDDVVGALEHALHTDTLRGSVNVTSPHPIRNAEFTAAMRQKLIPPFLPMHYWTPPVPALAVQLLLGEMGEALLLSSQRVQPVRLLESGYRFQHPTFREALDRLL